MIYNYEQLGKDSIISTDFYLFDSFHQHPFISTPCTTMIKPFNLDSNTTQAYYLHCNVNTPYPNLIGVQLVSHSRQGEFTVFQLSEEGALFSQSYSTTRKNVNITTEFQNEMRMKEFEICEEIRHLANQPLPKNAEANHTIIDLSSLFKSILLYLF
jgi:hypothetical protein